MFHRIGLLVAGLSLAAAPVGAQGRVEVSFSGGYSASDGVASSQVPLLGQVYDALDLKNGGSFNFTFGVFVTEKAEVEFLFGRQSSRLDATGPGATLPLSDLAISNYMANFTYNFGSSDAKIHPFVFGGIGATQYSFGDVLIPGATTNIEGDSRFTTNWGAGLKFGFSHVGAKVALRWTPTYIGSTTTGIWCDPFYGCWPIGDAHYANQFDTSVGVNVRFD